MIMKALWAAGKTHNSAVVDKVVFTSSVSNAQKPRNPFVLLLTLTLIKSYYFKHNSV